MNNEELKIVRVTDAQEINGMIHKVRGENVILDKDIATLYHVTTGALNQAVKRNIERFPQDFMFQLTAEEWHLLKSQSVIAKKGRGGLRTLPYVFTEHGVLMLAGVLKSDTAASVSIFIARTFAAMRRHIYIESTMSSDIATLKAKLELLENELEQNLGVVNDLSEDMRQSRCYLYRILTMEVCKNLVQGLDSSNFTHSFSFFITLGSAAAEF